jgi:hypothetical protein
MIALLSGYRKGLLARCRGIEPIRRNRAVSVGFLLKRSWDSRNR